MDCSEGERPVLELVDDLVICANWQCSRNNRPHCGRRVSAEGGFKVTVGGVVSVNEVVIVCGTEFIRRQRNPGAGVFAPLVQRRRE